MNVTELGRLQAVVSAPLPGRGRSPSNEGPTNESPGRELAVVLLHGFGAPGTDLVGLGRALDAPPGTRFVFPAAPLLLEPRLGPSSGRAWWPIDMMALQVARMTGQIDALERHKPEGLEEARAALGSLLTALVEEHGIAPERIVLGGFSQGAMLAADFAFRSELPLAGLVLLSATIVGAPEWQDLLPLKKDLPVFQSHSPEDPVLAWATAEKLGRWIVEAGLSHEFVSFRGGHGIGPEVVQALRAFLGRIAAAS